MNKEDKFKIIQQLLSSGYDGSISEVIQEKEKEEMQAMQQQQQQQQPQNSNVPTPALGGKVNLQPQQSSTERNIIQPGQYKSGGIRKYHEGGTSEQEHMYMMNNSTLDAHNAEWLAENENTGEDNMYGVDAGTPGENMEWGAGWNMGGPGLGFKTPYGSYNMLPTKPKNWGDAATLLMGPAANLTGLASKGMAAGTKAWDKVKSWFEDGGVRNIIQPGQYKRGGIKLNTRMDHGGTHDKDSYNHIPQDSLINRQQFNESRFKSDAVSEDGATSIAQIMPNTFADGLAKGYVPKGTKYEDLAADDALAEKFQVAYMKDLLGRDWNKGSAKVKRAKSLAAYNMGPTGLVNHLNAEKRRGVDIYDSLDWVDGLDKETREYVFNIMLGGDKEYEDEYNREHAKKFKGGGLWANINARKKAGTSRSKSDSTISAKNYANMKAGFPKKTGGYYSKYNKGGPTIDEMETFQFDPSAFQQYENVAVAESTGVQPPIIPIIPLEDLPVVNVDSKATVKKKNDKVEEEEVDNILDPIGEEFLPFSPPELFVHEADNTLYIRPFTIELTPEEMEKASQIFEENETITDVNTKASNIDISERRNANRDKKTKQTVQEETKKTLDAFYNQFRKIDYDKVSEDQVTAMQTTLVDAGYNLGKYGPNGDGIDGKFGNKTRLAYLDYMESKLNTNSGALTFDPAGRETSCDETGCAEYVTNEFMNEGYDVNSMQVGGDAWTMYDQMITKGNGTSVFNIFNGDEFNNVTSTSDAKKKSINAYRNNKPTKNQFKEGDVIGLVYEHSSNWDNAYEAQVDGNHFYGDKIKNNTYNSHVGFVSGFNENGEPIISHNVNGKVYNDVYTNIHGGGVAWIARPNAEGQTGDRRYNYEENTTEHDNTEHLDWLGTKNETTYSPEVREIQNNSINFIKNNVPIILDELEIPINGDDGEVWFQEAIIGIGMVETSLGNSIPDVPEAQNKRRVKQAVDLGINTLTGDKSIPTRIGDIFTGDFTDVTTDPNDISSGITKTKLNKVGNGTKSYYNIGAQNISTDHNKALAVTIDNFARNYHILTDYASKNPQLELTEQDIRNMTILSHNRGLLSKNSAGGGTGANFGQRNDMTIAEQIESLRTLYEGSMSDMSSTNYRFLPEFIGKPLYDKEFGEDGSETYVSKVNRFINRQVETHETLEAKEKEDQKTLSLLREKNVPPPNTAKMGGYRSKYGF